MQIDIFSDTVCPWCYLGKRRLELAVAARPHYDIRLKWRPFELNPELPLDGVPRSSGGAESQAELERQGSACGIPFRFELIQRIPNTRFSHLLIAFAARRGRGGAAKERIMRGYFEEGRDIGDVEELVQLGAEAGLPAGEARRALIVRAGQDGIVAAERHAHVLGITGVPTFILDGTYTLSGAQEVGTFTQVLDQVADFAAAKGVTG